MCCSWPLVNLSIFPTSSIFPPNYTCSSSGGCATITFVLSFFKNSIGTNTFNIQYFVFHTAFRNNFILKTWVWSLGSIHMVDVSTDSCKLFLTSILHCGTRVGLWPLYCTVVHVWVFDLCTALWRVCGSLTSILLTLYSHMQMSKCNFKIIARGRWRDWLSGLEYLLFSEKTSFAS